jgi:DNA-binding LacI/PurR family transcriptional regulator/DNA-binding transcriptional regulator YhcF (GntR family)
MRPISQQSLPQQVAAHLREGIQRARWSSLIPGVPQLASELDVGRNTVRQALKILELEGLLGDRGGGRSRAITDAAATTAAKRPLRVNILRHDAQLTDNPVLIRIIYSLEAAGHDVFSCKKSQIELKHDVARLCRHLAANPADAWVVESGSHALLEWCASQPIPCLALFGRTDDLQMARTGPDSVPAYQVATRQLIEQGHRRIVLIVREGFRRPTPGRCEMAFLEELRARDIPTSAYNLPDWEETAEGFNHLMENLFKLTPPTALIIDEICWFTAALAFFVRHGIRVPEQVSLVSGDCESTLDQCHPGFAQMRWDYSLIVRRVVRWVDAVRKGKADRKIINIPAEFVPGGSIGPVWRT